MHKFSWIWAFGNGDFILGERVVKVFIDHVVHVSVDTAVFLEDKVTGNVDTFNIFFIVLVDWVEGWGFCFHEII